MLEETVIFAIIIDIVVRYISTDSIRGSLYVIRRVSHGNAGAGKFQHGQVVIPVPKSKDTFPGDIQNATKVRGHGLWLP